MKKLALKFIILILTIYINYNIIDDRFLDPAKLDLKETVKFEICKERTRYIHLIEDIPLSHEPNEKVDFLNYFSFSFYSRLNIIKYQKNIHFFSLYPNPPPFTNS